MEAVLVLLLVAWALLFFIVFPIWALIAVRRSNRKAEDVLDRLTRLETTLANLSRDFAATKENVAASQPHREPIVAVETPKPDLPPPPPVEPARPRPTPPPFQPAPIDPAPEPKAAPEPAASQINWERFMGVNLFAWIGGFVLFLGAAFFVKYSIDNNLISPQIRIALGLLLGIGLLAGGLRLSSRKYAVTSHTLCATSIVILYADIFAAHSFYGFINQTGAFLLMMVITAAAILLAIRLDAKVVAILGLLGGFLTPTLLSTGQDNPLGLFGYIAFLDAGLIAVSLRKRWSFLATMAAAGTALLQIAWVDKFFEVHKLYTSMAIFFSFQFFFALAWVASVKKDRYSRFFSAASILLPFVTLAFLFYLLTIEELGLRPAELFAFALASDICLLVLPLLRPSLSSAHRIAGIFIFLLLSIWTSLYLSTELLPWALALYLVFSLLHMVFPIVLERFHPETKPTALDQIFAPLALLLILIPVFRLTELSMGFWFAVLLLDAMAIAFAILTTSVFSIIAVLILTVLSILAWLINMPQTLTGLPQFLTVTAGFTFVFFAAGIYAGKRIARNADDANVDTLAQVPALSAVLPFLLLIMSVIHLPVLSPSPVFALGLVLVLLMLVLARMMGPLSLFAMALLSTIFLEFVWHTMHFSAAAPAIPLFWYLAFYAVFTAFPYLLRKQQQETVLPWATTAIAAPLHFYLIYRVIEAAYPNPYPGIIPALFSIPSFLILMQRIRSVPPENPARNGQLAWLGGVTLLFVTLIFPIQFERHWILIGWALEGAALLWLFHRVPHPGLKVAGAGLLVISFLGLTNPGFFLYEPRSGARIYNWYLYTYGTVTFALLAGAKWMDPPNNKIGALKIQPVLYTLSVILAFLLMNIEIADYYSNGTTLNFRFSGNFARDMTYSIAWASFAFGLLIIGIRKKYAAARYGSLLLLGCTLVKLFLHDLANLKSLYRVGALMGVAVILILASYLYQRFVSFEPAKENTTDF